MGKISSMTDSQQIRLLSSIASCLSFTFLVAADLFTLKNNVTLVSAGILGMIWAGPLNMLAGASKYSSFRLWMPFNGGQKFVVLQSLGWFLYASCLTSSVIVMFNLTAVKRMQGILSALGLLGCASTSILNASISFFEDDRKVINDPHDISLPPSIIGLRIIWNAHSVVSLMVTLGGVLFFLIADIFRSQWFAVPLLWIGSAAFGLSSIITQFLNGPCELDGYHFFQPFEGGWSFVTLQGFGWMFLGVVLQCVMAMPFDASLLTMNGLLSCLGITGLFSQVTLVASLSHFREDKNPAKGKEPQGVVTQGKERRSLSAQMYFCLMLMVWPSFLFVAVYFLHKAFPSIEFSLDIKTIVLNLMPMLFASGPLSHAAGKTMYNAYAVWQPFEGGMVYIIAQAFGWMLYSISATLGAVYFYNNYSAIKIEMIIRLLPLIFLGQFIVWLSVLQFDPERITKKVSGENRRGAATNERLAAVLLAICGCLMCVFAESTHKDETTQLYIRPWLISGAFLTLMACAVAQFAGVQVFKSFHIWQPFKGGKVFIIMQVCSWTSVGMWFLVKLVVCLSPNTALEIYGLVSSLGAWGAVNVGFLIYTQNFFEENASEADISLSLFIKIPTSRSKDITEVVRRLKFYASVQDKKTDSESKMACQVLTLLSQELETSCQEQLDNSPFFGITAEETLNVLFFVLSFGLFISSDIMRSATTSLSKWSEVPFFFACISGVFSIMWTHLLCGPARHPGSYTTFMPFQGGFTFVTLQGLAWTLFGLSIVCLSTCFFVSVRAIPMDGVVSAVGLNYFVSQVLLFLSIFIYDPQSMNSQSLAGSSMTKRHQNVEQDVKEKFNYEGSSHVMKVKSASSLPNFVQGNRLLGGFLSILIGIGSLGCFAGADIATYYFGAEFPVLPARVCAVVAIFISVPLTWWLTIHGIHHRDTQRPKQVIPQGGLVTLQLLGWALWSFTVLVGVLFCYGVIEQTTLVSGSLSGTLTGISGIIAQILVLLSIEGSDVYSRFMADSPAKKTQKEQNIFSLASKTFWQCSSFMAGFFKSHYYYHRWALLRQVLWTFVIVSMYVLHKLSNSVDKEWLLDFHHKLPVYLLIIPSVITMVVISIGLCIWFIEKFWNVLLPVVVESVASNIILPSIRFFLNWPMFYYALWWRDGHFAQDGKKVMEGINIKRRVQYGGLSSEVLDIMWPLGQDLSGKEPTYQGSILYAHGGGFVSCNSEILLHSITPLARSGYCVYSVDYPLSPEAKYPSAVLSILKALHWMKVRDGVNQVFLLGDSAGGNIVTVAAALLGNRKMLKELSLSCDCDIHLLSFPKVRRVCSIYGILDQNSWKTTWSGYIVNYCLKQYKSSHEEKNFPITLLDFTKKQLQSYPETLLICGDQDGLLQSSKLAGQKLNDSGCEAKVRIYPGVHGFLGFPIQWTLGTWKENSCPATEDILTFFRFGNMEIDGKKRIVCPRSDVPSDPSVVVVALLLSGCFTGTSWYGMKLASRAFETVCRICT